LILHPRIARSWLIPPVKSSVPSTIARSHRPARGHDGTSRKDFVPMAESMAGLPLSTAC
jgi:hypothetical protein